MDLQGGLNFLQGGGNGGINIQGSQPNLQASPSSGLSIQPAASGNILLNPNTRLAPTPAATPAAAPPAPVTAATTATPAITYPDKSNDIAMQQAGLGSADATRDAALGVLNEGYADTMGNYSSDLNAAQGSYTDESNANQTDLQGNKQTALENATQGRQGLYGTLASLGALSGTGVELANHAVQSGANQDLTTAADTYATNQSGLDNGYGAYTASEERLEDKATAAYNNDIGQAQNDYYKNQQTYLKNLSDDYTAEGNTAQAANYSKQVAALFPQIASTNVPTVDFGYTGSSYTAPTLASYVGAANNTSVATQPAPAGSGPLAIPGLIAMSKKQS
jgi:hypothetical protein